MLDLTVINEQIQEITATIKKLVKEKTEAENKRNEMETTLSEFLSVSKQIIAGINEFDSVLNEKTNNIPGNFGLRYRDRMNDAFKKGGARDAEGQQSSINLSLKKAILNLDDVIEDLTIKIFENNSLLNKLKQMALQAAEAIEELVEDVVEG